MNCWRPDRPRDLPQKTGKSPLAPLYQRGEFREIDLQARGAVRELRTFAAETATSIARDRIRTARTRE